MAVTFVAPSIHPNVERVFFYKDPTLGWKLDVETKDGAIYPESGDAWEETLDRILLYLVDFVDAATVWSEEETGRTATFWDVVTRHLSKAPPHQT